jgi:hypothetical protein
MNSQPKKIRPINKLIPTGNIKPQAKNPSYNLAMGTPIQSKRPFNKDQNGKSASPLNQGNLSARGSKNVNLKGSSSNFGAGMRNNDNSKSSYLDANNAFRMNSAGKKLDYKGNGVNKISANNKSNQNLNLYGVIKGKNLIYF